MRIINICGGSYPIHCNLGAFEDMCEVFGSTEKLEHAIDATGKNFLADTITLVTCLVNCGFEKLGRPDRVERSWVRQHIGFKGLPELRKEIQAEISEFMRREFDDDQDIQVDVTLEKLDAAKNAQRPDNTTPLG